jgi:hypothetical protein
MLYWLFRLEMGTNIERLPLESMKTIRLTSGLRLCMGLLGLAILSTQSNASPSPRSKAIYGVFFNESRGALQLNIVNPRKKDTSIATIRGGNMELAVLHAGDLAKIYTSSTDMLSGPLLASYPIPNPDRTPEFFETSSRTFYFRLVGRNIVLLKPADLTIRQRKQVKALSKELQSTGAFEDAHLGTVRDRGRLQFGAGRKGVSL